MLRNLWLPAGSRTVNSILTASRFPRGTRIQVTCSGSGCAFRKAVRKVTSRRAVKLSGLFGDRSLGRGARVEVRLTHAGRIGRVLRFRITATPGVPSVAFRCKPPGQRVRDC